MREIDCEQRLEMGGGGDDKPGAKVYDPIALNSIWREHIKKERGVLKLNEKFRLNPHALAVSLHLPCHRMAAHARTPCPPAQAEHYPHESRVHSVTTESRTYPRARSPGSVSRCPLLPPHGRVAAGGEIGLAQACALLEGNVQYSSSIPRRFTTGFALASRLLPGPLVPLPLRPFTLQTLPALR